MPSFTNYLFQNKHSSSNRSSTTLSPTPPVASTPPTSPTPASPLRPNISAPIPAPGSAQYSHPTVPTQQPSDRSSSRQTIQLVPPSNDSTTFLPSPLTPLPASRGGAEFAAEHQQRTLQHLNGGSSSSDLNDITYNPSSSSSSTSVTARRGTEPPSTPSLSSSRKPGGFNLGTVFSGSRDRERASTPVGHSGGGGGGIGRRISVRKHHQQQPVAPPPEAQPYHQHDPYLQGPPQSRPQSLLHNPRENEAIDYSLHHGGEPLGQHQLQQPLQRHNSFSQAGHHSRQYYEQGQEYLQQQPPPLEYQHHHQHLQQQLQQQQLQPQQEVQMIPQLSNQPRQSMDTRGPSRESSSVSQMQQQYAGQGQGASGGGQPPNQPYDPSKFDEQGRSTPEHRAQSGSGDSTEQMDLMHQQTKQELETLQSKYRKVKSLYFERSAEIERLQNTLAHQRLAQSRTSLDDNEYTQRFERLDGAIKNVAFEIRQSWKTIPAWLTDVINLGAAAKGGREMTVVGRAHISQWVAEEIMERFFHPALEPTLSIQLKDIERNIRYNAPQHLSHEDDDALSAKVCNWRLTTLDALQHQISGPKALEARHSLAEHLVRLLMSSLQQYLHEPTPPGLLGGIQMVVDIAIGLAANIPVESREVRVCYPRPGEFFDTKFMRSEGGLPPLGTPASSAPESDKMQTDNSSNKSGTEDAPPPAPAKDLNPSSRAGIAGLPAQQPKPAETKKSTSFSGKVKKALGSSTSSPQPQAPPSPSLPAVSNGKQPQQQLTQQQPAEQPQQADKIRVAGFMAVEVRGRSILVKAPVWL